MAINLVKTPVLDGKTDTRGKFYAISKDGRILTYGSNPAMAENPMPLQPWIDLASKYQGDLQVSDSPIVKSDMSMDTAGLIFGYTWDQIQAMQRGENVRQYV